jgi:hypothetical protein
MLCSNYFPDEIWALAREYRKQEYQQIKRVLINPPVIRDGAFCIINRSKSSAHLEHWPDDLYIDQTGVPTENSLNKITQLYKIALSNTMLLPFSPHLTSENHFKNKTKCKFTNVCHIKIIEERLNCSICLCNGDWFACISRLMSTLFSTVTRFDWHHRRTDDLCINRTIIKP